VDLVDLTRRQRLSLWLDGHVGLHTVADALAFVDEVAVALRYGASTNLPLASMYRATQRQVPVPEDEQPAHGRAFELTNALLASGHVIEINLIANRLVLAHARVMPAIYRLRRGMQDPQVSEPASQTLEFIIANQNASSGDIRRLLRAEGQPRPDAADLALTELQRELLIDRGPSSGPGHGVFYLSRDGYPYRAFEPAHPDIVASSRNLSLAQAAAGLLTAYLGSAVFATRRPLVSMFKSLLGADDIDRTIETLQAQNAVQVVDVSRRQIIVYKGRRSA
jgi:hypothetical protein